MLATLIAAQPARAQNGFFGNLERNIDSMLGNALDMMPRGLHSIRIGLGPSVAPKFRGDSEYSVAASPVVSLRYKDLVEVDNNAVRVNVFGNWGSFTGKGSAWSAGPAVNIDFGRSDDDSPKLRGLGDVSTALTLGAFVAYRTDVARYRVRARADVTGAHSGWLIDGRVDWRVVNQAKFTANIGTQITWASGNFTRAWFGVTPMQSVASGLPVFRAGSGLHDASLSASAEYVINARWSILGSAGYTRLLGDASGSPLVKLRGSPNQLSAAVFAVYAF